MTQKQKVLLAAISLSLTGCDTLRDTFGLSHYQADDFAVHPNPSLSIPPDFSLVPPQPGAKGREEKTAPQQAHQTIFGQASAVKTSSQSNTMEKELIQTAAQGKEVDSSIRRTVNKEADSDNPLTNAITSLKNQAVRNLKLPSSKNRESLPSVND